MKILGEKSWSAAKEVATSIISDHLLSVMKHSHVSQEMSVIFITGGFEEGGKVGEPHPFLAILRNKMI